MFGLTPAEIHAHFSTRSGAEQIATRFAIERLEECLFRYCPARICEVGAGLGTLSWVVSEYLAYGLGEAVAVEDDPWCRSQWQANLAFFKKRPALFEKLPVYEFYDLVILDGPQMPPDGWACLAPRAVVFVEGNRRAQRARLRQYLRNVGRRFCETPSRPPDRSKGVWIVQCDPTARERVASRARRIMEGVRDWPARIQGRPIGKRLAILLLVLFLSSGCAAAGIIAGTISATSDVVGIVKWHQDRTFQAEANEALRQQTEAIRALETELTATRQTLHEDLRAVHDDLQRVLKPGP